MANTQLSRCDLLASAVLFASTAGARAGVANLFPDLATSSSVASREPTSLIRVVLRGTQSVSTPSARPSMPAYGWQLNDAVLTFTRDSWGHAAVPVSERNVRNARARLATRSD